nr:TolC family protein [Roseococcus microcysteis]
MRQRPDILAAEAALRAANAGIGVATANMLPRLALTAGYGTAQGPGGDAFTPQGLIWSMAAGPAHPLLQGDGWRPSGMPPSPRAMPPPPDTGWRCWGRSAMSRTPCARSRRMPRSCAPAARLRAPRRSRGRSRGGSSALAPSRCWRSWPRSRPMRARIALVQATAARFSDTVALHIALGGGVLTDQDLSRLSP